MPRLHEIFSAVYQTEKLWVTIDRGSFKVPSSFHESGFRMDAVHWDGDPRGPNEMAVQGLIYLTDTPAEKGAFAQRRGDHVWNDEPTVFEQCVVVVRCRVLHAAHALSKNARTRSAMSVALAASISRGSISATPSSRW